MRFACVYGITHIQSQYCMQFKNTNKKKTSARCHTKNEISTILTINVSESYAWRFPTLDLSVCNTLEIFVLCLIFIFFFTIFATDKRSGQTLSTNEHEENNESKTEKRKDEIPNFYFFFFLFAIICSVSKKSVDITIHTHTCRHIDTALAMLCYAIFHRHH